MDRSSEDALWRSIVENYGDRADLDDAAPSSGSDDGADGGPTDSTAASGAPATNPTGAAPGPAAGPADHGVVEGPAESGGRAPAGGEPGATGAAGADWEAARARAGSERAAEFEARHEVPDRFVPPDPGPLPYVDPARLGAWACVVGGPLLIILSLTVGLPLPGFWRLMSAVAFVGGFVYLVARMPRDPRDPWDDGARV